MKMLVCIDDTDNLESRGTGKLASILAEDLENDFRGQSGFVTRHQLFVHPDVPYTSHNSSMCFAAELDRTKLDSFIDHASQFLRSQSAPGSDPGLCVARLEDRNGLDELIGFGRRAKMSVLTKKDAYELALRHNIHLSAHGGTGDGVIGALAGVGLRLSGNDGRLRGKLQIGEIDSAVSVAVMRTHAPVDVVRSIGGKPLYNEELVRLGEKVKAVYLEGKAVLLVSPLEPAVEGIHWRTCSRQELQSY